MKTKQTTFQKYYSRLCFEGALKSLIFGLTIGFAVNFVLSAIAWFVDYKNLWLPIGAGIGVAVVIGVIAYFTKFKPNAKSIARRLDRLGLEERAITMLEFENDQSYLAFRQREDAKVVLAKTSAKSLKIRLSKVAIIFVAVTCVLGCSMTTVAGLAAEDIIPPGIEMIPPSPEDYVAVSYVVEDGGEIIGETDQLVIKGEDATEVTAEAMDGFAFLEWSDGWDHPTRQDKNVTEDLEIYAIFEEMAEDEGDGEGDSAQDGDQADDEPGNDSNNGENQNGEGGDQDASGDGQPGEDAEGSGDEQGEGKGDGQGNGGGGKWEDQNTVIDGETYYYDIIETYKEIAMQYLAANQEIPPELKAFIETYYNGLI